MNMDILRTLALKGPLKPTLIMYKANLNYDLLKRYLDFLIKQGLIEERLAGRGGLVYSITRQGWALLKDWKEINGLLPSVDSAAFQKRSFC